MSIRHSCLAGNSKIEVEEWDSSHTYIYYSVIEDWCDLKKWMGGGEPLVGRDGCKSSWQS